MTTTGHQLKQTSSKKYKSKTQHLRTKRRRLTKQVDKKEVLKNYDLMLNHLVSHITDPKESIDNRDFSQSKLLIDAIKKVKSGGKSARSKRHSRRKN